MTSGKRWLAWLAVIVLAATRAVFPSDHGTGSPADPLPGIKAVRDERHKVTNYVPGIDEWPWPDLLVYPVVTASDSGTRLPAAATPAEERNQFWLLRTAVDPSALSGAVRREIRAVDRA